MISSTSHGPRPLQQLLDRCLPFEREMLELELRLRDAPTLAEREHLTQEVQRQRQEVFAKLTPWQRVQLARHPLRPRMSEYLPAIFEDFEELHGDRCGGDDPALIGGIARFQGQSLVLVGQEKGLTTEERVRRNFGMMHPEGYRKALRLFRLAERMGLPVASIVDTPAAHPGVEAEAGGQGVAIAENLLAMAGLRTPIFTAVIGEGGSGGALGIAMGDYVVMFEHAIYVICPPERCAEILWRDAEKKDLAAAALRVTAHDLIEFGIVDAVMPEPLGGAHRDTAAAADVLSKELAHFLKLAKTGAWPTAKRQERYQRIGVWQENAEQVAAHVLARRA